MLTDIRQNFICYKGKKGGSSGVFLEESRLPGRQCDGSKWMSRKVGNKKKNVVLAQNQQTVKDSFKAHKYTQDM